MKLTQDMEEKCIHIIYSYLSTEINSANWYGIQNSRYIFRSHNACLGSYSCFLEDAPRHPLESNAQDAQPSVVMLYMYGRFQSYHRTYWRQ